jgi:hypothetical protein
MIKPIKIFPEGSYVNGIDIHSILQYNLFVDMIPQHVNDFEINILLLSEPDIITGISKDLTKSHSLFHYILTHNQDILDKYLNAKLFIFNSVWATNKDYSPKEFSISTLVGNKTWTKQQVMRQELWFKQDKIENKKFYASSFGPPSDIMGNEFIGENKDALFNSQFHIAIENCSIDNYFTEKILDCFISKTIPIYCGCVNIEKYFNDKGIIKFNNINECISECNKLNKDTYKEMLPYVEENYKIALQYINWQERLKNAIKKFRNPDTITK